MNARTVEARGRLIIASREALERPLGAPWGPADTLPCCSICGTPPMPQLRKPHAARVIAWGHELAASEARR